MQASTSGPPVSRPGRLHKWGRRAPTQHGPPPPDANGAEPIEEPSHPVREESLETDVASHLLDREPVTCDDLH